MTTVTPNSCQISSDITHDPRAGSGIIHQSNMHFLLFYVEAAYRVTAETTQAFSSRGHAVLQTTLTIAPLLWSASVIRHACSYGLTDMEAHDLQSRLQIGLTALSLPAT